MSNLVDWSLRITSLEKDRKLKYGLTAVKTIHLNLALSLQQIQSMRFPGDINDFWIEKGQNENVSKEEEIEIKNFLKLIDSKPDPIQYNISQISNKVRNLDLQLLEPLRLLPEEVVLKYVESHLKWNKLDTFKGLNLLVLEIGEVRRRKFGITLYEDKGKTFMLDILSEVYFLMAVIERVGTEEDFSFIPYIFKNKGDSGRSRNMSYYSGDQESNDEVLLSDYQAGVWYRILPGVVERVVDNSDCENPLFYFFVKF